MRASERKMYEQEAEIRPNHYVAIALAVISFFIIGMMLANEVGLFRVDKIYMRIGAISSLIVLEIPLYVAGSDAGLKSEKTKYYMIGCTGLMALIICVMLNFHATLIIVLPMLLAAQYPSRRISRISIRCSVLTAFFAPLVGYLVGVWDSAFLQELCMISGFSVIPAAAGEKMSTGQGILEILLYLSLPHTAIVLAFSPLSSAIARNGEDRLNNQIQVLHMSESDALTGLLNRHSFEVAITHEVIPEDGNVAIVYADANDLHRINNEQGHSAGDCLLVCVAENLRAAYGDENVYRTGGDEFIVISYGRKIEEVQDCLKQVRAKLEEHGYSIAAGVEYAQPPCTLPVLIDAAECKMMMDKKQFHNNRLGGKQK